MVTTGATFRSLKKKWTPEEDEILCAAVQEYQGKSWIKIAEFLPDRTKVQCLHRWQKVLNPELVKGHWTKEEDEIIVHMVQKHGPKKWSTIAEALPGRIGKQCRERWLNQLNPEIKKEAWSKEEEIILIDAHSLHGNKWAALTKYLPGRTENSIKNWWNCSLKKRINMYEEVPRDAESTGKKENQVIPFSHSQGKMVNDGNSLELEIDSWLEDKENTLTSTDMNYHVPVRPVKESQVIPFSHSQGKMVNDAISLDLEIDSWLEDNPDKENVPPDLGSGSKTTPIKEGATENEHECSGNKFNGTSENLNIFADTPGIKRGLESPSAWKSPWYMNSCIAGEMLEFSFQEMGFSMSPVASYDTLALMQHFSENTSPVVAEAREVLNVSNKKSAAKRDLACDENSRPNKQPRMTGSRVLDFTDCSSPVRLVEQRRIRSAGLGEGNNYLG